MTVEATGITLMMGSSLGRQGLRSLFRNGQDDTKPRSTFAEIVLRFSSQGKLHSPASHLRRGLLHNVLANLWRWPIQSKGGGCEPRARIRAYATSERAKPRGASRKGPSAGSLGVIG